MEIDDRPNFSFGVTQDFDVIPVSNNEKKDLTPVPISAYTPEGKASDVFMFHGRRVTSKSNIMRSPYYSRVADPYAGLSSEESKVTKYLFLTNHDSYTDILFKSKSGQQSDRLQMESVGQEYVETNILDTWAVVRNHMEEYRSNDSPFRLFLPTFVVDKDSFSQIRNDDGRFEIVAQHVESKKDKILKKSKVRKGAKIGNSIVAEMLIGEYDWQTATVRPYAGLILIRIMETYMGKGMRNWDLRLDSNRVKLQKKLTMLCKKYAATILMSDCNVLKEQVKAHMDHASEMVEKGALFGFDRQENMCEVLTHKAFESVADEVERSIEKSYMEIDDRPNFIADPDAGLSSEESKVTKYLFLTNHDSYTDILFKSKSGQQSDRLQMESVGQEYVETNILDTWAVVFLPVDNEGHRFVLTFDLKYGAGFGHGELEEDFVEEDGDPIPNNIENIFQRNKKVEQLLTAAETICSLGTLNLVGNADKYINSLKCIWGGNNSGINATMPQTQEKEKDVQGKAGCPNMNRVEALNDLGFRAQRNEEVEVGVRDIGVNEQTPGPGKDLIGVTKNSCAVVVVKKDLKFG
ncbi:hypothetical protein Tco_1017910 [Tanacetum coccineum]|uniref:Uncharacterized protein n=1 Tax=Tanacetum coccineum TaxID=301880 RepID=A0ABQ5FT05_9ASTR